MAVAVREGNIPSQIHKMKNQIVITSHARQRWYERVPEEYRICKKLKDVAFKARYYGINLNCFNDNEVDNKELYDFLLHNFRFKTMSNVMRYWEGYVYVFAGKHSRTLITIINIPDHIKEGIV